MERVLELSQKNAKIYCCVPECINCGGQGLSFHHFPTEETKRKQWERALKIGRKATISMRVCSEHFLPTDFVPGETKTGKKHLKRNVIPSQKLPAQVPDITKISTRKRRTEVYTHPTIKWDPDNFFSPSVRFKISSPNMCSVQSCRNSSKKTKKAGVPVRYFPFPEDRELRDEWVRRCYRKDDFDPKWSKICSLHFEYIDYEDGVKAKLMKFIPRKLKPDAVPSRNLRDPSEIPPEIFAKKEEIIKAERKKLVEELLNASANPVRTFRLNNSGKDAIKVELSDSSECDTSDNETYSETSSDNSSGLEETIVKKAQPVIKRKSILKNAPNKPRILPNVMVDKQKNVSENTTKEQNSNNVSDDLSKKIKDEVSNESDDCSMNDPSSNDAMDYDTSIDETSNDSLDNDLSEELDFYQKTDLVENADTGKIVLDLKGIQDIAKEFEENLLHETHKHLEKQQLSDLKSKIDSLVEENRFYKKKCDTLQKQLEDK